MVEGNGKTQSSETDSKTDSHNIRSVSEYNPEVAVMQSMVGESVVPFSTQRQEGLRVLCLDGGGMKVKKIASFFLIRCLIII